ncbi:MAG: elongation factor P maturation arginine rhamnosyltransferase EarP [Nitrosomonadaceae bacterium]|jgi:uncharacterized repeat protein (TIGR03837 family)|nr:elongation factor P maturation arginine rhamnosyltransferase EarP [Nitrosomonadaceae bacterium]
MKLRWDIFCTSIDNFGDVGFSWRLARQLVNEHGLEVRLWVDDLAIFSQIESAIDVDEDQQWLQGVEICSWRKSFAEIEPADVVIETFACTLPDNYILAMADLPQQPVWINLEYLSAENWTLDCHCLPSFHPHLPLKKYFFFPGFVEGTGGLLLEKNLLPARVAFNNTSQDKFWQELGLQSRREGELCISLFCYDDAPIEELLSAWVISDVPIRVLVPQHSVNNAIGIFFGVDLPTAGQVLQSGKLQVCIIPFLAQDNYDQLLWACDINFVRGEDSFVRAQWAERVFIWNIYPQAEHSHRLKLEAYLNLYTERMPPEMSAAVFSLWNAWNGNGQMINAWSIFAAQMSALTEYGNNWIRQLLPIGDLASNLVKFSRKDQI